jgi:tetratricopeptide (TPR) repeat protein
LEPTFKTAFHLMSTQSRYALERRAWDEAAAIIPREPATIDWDRFPWAEAEGRFARGLGNAHLGKIDEARGDSYRLAQLETVAQKAGEDLFARNIRMLHLELEAWLAHVSGREDASVSLMEEAVTLEESTPKHAVTPGPTLPAREMLGDLLMEQKQPARALAAYQRSLELYPKRFNSLLGAMRAARASGDAISSRKYYVELLRIARLGSRRIKP